MSKCFEMRLSGLNISVKYRYDYLPQFCKDYIIEGAEKTDIFAETTEEKIADEHQNGVYAPLYSCESLCIYREIAEQLPMFSRFVFHGAAISYKDKAYVFTAPSGTGKTTHISLWKKHIGDSVGIVNGDKPIFHIGETTTVYGTPWAGKENLQKNTSDVLGGICIIKRGLKNKITKLEQSMVLPYIMNQVYMPQNRAAMDATIKLIDRLITTVPVYLLECDISEEAVRTSFTALTGKKQK